MRILVIEDEERIAASLRRGLTAVGYTVDVAHDGIDGLHMAREHRYAAVLLDLMLPGLSGYQVCARLRAEGNDVPVLMLTAKNGEYDEAEGLDTGADDYLAKPFSYVVLEARLRALVRRGGARLSTVLQAGDLWLDPARRACGRGTDRITLTPKEFAVLHCLLSRPDEVVPALDVIDEVWSADFTGDPNIVHVYISAVRKKIDIPFGRNTIETVRGAGYRVNARA
ncbi:response regulator [Streptomyces hydrogenans]|uniref:DNA-binding response regulator n=1 Tax=Streptomyces hydrogenans TaxID=1873719 RepID=A0ABQ3PHU2_9ACTN|nr:response regulator transcription factor [Streptomyces hydrogenans]GHG19906.1 DNA-binding response regulator [Streptomyces hydrogenans]GHI22820.1 DNA-binding response regulator [Streptomyces hydrogenans]GHI24289.1 DNA-binding response regulator [Streptomyces hydrogenans]GHI24565.1 DNA-binding response regulator [Streptomyces hydrogenans]GHI24584.1 DNA-binding response regulator [Streptomyces hydrogenans]